MYKTFIKSKLHRVRVTDANLNYQGSITIGQELMQAAGIEPFELVHINNLSNAAHWETYAIPGTKGQIVLNGPPSRLFQAGDLVVVLSMIHLSVGETTVHRTVFVNPENEITEVMEKPCSFFLGEH